MNRLAIKAVRDGKLRRNFLGEMISFLLEVAFWPLCLSLKLFLLGKKKS
jgi:hypothetical protein